jgi:16S rRNA (cytosine1402-N4)-methyltransferase
MLFDLGVSSPQLDDVSRGFSYMADTELDMRMDTDESLTAFEIINEWTQEALQKIFRQYGEERYATSIARAIVRKRESKPIKSTFELNNIIFSAIPAAARREKQHPSKRCFQAIRIAVNDELGSIERMLETAIDRLNPGGRLCVISFHSLEDRIVKKAFTSAVSGCTCPSKLPVCACGFEPKLKIIAKKPITPTDEEIERNPRARSAKFRVAEKI